MRHDVIWIRLALPMLAGLSLIGAFAFADVDVFVPTNEQRDLLKEAIECVKELKRQYTHLTMEGTTEYFYSEGTEGFQRFTGDFSYARLGDEYCLIEMQVPHPAKGPWAKPDMTRVCRLINPNASYQFVAQGSPPSFVLNEKVKLKNSTQLQQAIDDAVLWNWQVGSTPYRSCVDLSLPFDISTARHAKPEQGGWIKGINENTVDGERVVTLKMGYYFNDSTSEGEISFYRDHHWAVKNSIVEGVNPRTGELVLMFKTSNDYDFSDTFPKLKKTTIETWDVSSNVLRDSKIGTIMTINFTTPDVTAFDPKRYISGKQEKDWDALLPTTQRFTSWQIAGIMIGILLIVWGIWMRLKKTEK